MKVRSIPVFLVCSLVGGALFSCTSSAPKAVPAPVFSPIASPPIAPAVDKVRENAAKTAAVAVKLEGQVAGLQQSTASLAEGMAAALAEADRLRSQKTASVAEVDSLWQMLKASDAKVRNLFTEVEAARSTASEQTALRVVSEQTITELVAAAAARDIADAAKDKQSADKDRLIKTQSDEIQSQSIKLLAAEKKAAVGGFLKLCLGIAGGVIVLMILFKLFWRG